MRHMLLTAGLLFAAVMTYASVDDAHAGLFDFLNQGTPEPQQRTIERPAPDLPPVTPLPKYRVEAPRHITVIHKNASGKASVVAHQSVDFPKDGTLRDGDAVMTKNGIRIFAGSNDFVTLSETKGLSSAERIALAEIDAHRSEEGWQSKSSGQDQLITGRSAANMAHAWKWVRDPKGVLVRYVGP
jgi:hypothetical protein